LLNIKKAIVTFHYAEKIKSNLIIAVSLLRVLDGMKDEEMVGAEKLLVAYFDALIQEVNIAANASGVHEFQDVNVKLAEATRQTRQHDYANVMKLLSEATSITTTSGISSCRSFERERLDLILRSFMMVQIFLGVTRVLPEIRLPEMTKLLVF
jgi:hypothetical protein